MNPPADYRKGFQCLCQRHDQTAHENPNGQSERAYEKGAQIGPHINGELINIQYISQDSAQNNHCLIQKNMLPCTGLSHETHKHADNGQERVYAGRNDAAGAQTEERQKTFFK